MKRLGPGLDKLNHLVASKMELVSEIGKVHHSPMWVYLLVHQMGILKLAVL